MQAIPEGGQLQDRIILITGAARGIGASVAKSCAAHGATVILLDKQLKQLESVYDEIESATQTEPVLYPLDLKGASLADYQQLAETIEQTYGKLDGLIHCAASLGQLAPTQHLEAKNWVETLHINLTAAFLLTQACLPLLRKAETSRLIFTSDDHKGKAYWGAYGISKAAIETFAHQLADELEAEAKVFVNIITPGPTHSELYTRAFPAIDPTPLPKPDQIAQQYLALLLNNETLPL